MSSLGDFLCTWLLGEWMEILQEAVRGGGRCIRSKLQNFGWEIDIPTERLGKVAHCRIMISLRYRENCWESCVMQKTSFFLELILCFISQPESVPASELHAEWGRSSARNLTTPQASQPPNLIRTQLFPFHEQPLQLPTSWLLVVGRSTSCHVPSQQLCSMASEWPSCDPFVGLQQKLILRKMTTGSDASAEPSRAEIFPKPQI